MNRFCSTQFITSQAPLFEMVKMEERTYEEVSVHPDVSTSTINDHIVKAGKFRENLKHHHLEVSGLFFALLLRLIL